MVMNKSILQALRRSREGAWIEIAFLFRDNLSAGVAPARERGLKSSLKLRRGESRLVAPARERGLKS